MEEYTISPDGKINLDIEHDYETIFGESAEECVFL